MQRLIDNTKKIFSTKTATLLILLISISSRAIQMVFFFNIRVDRSYQLLATQNFVHGNGITTAEVMPADLSKIIYTPLVKWPPGYSILLSPFYAISGNDYLLSSLFLDVVFAIILIFVTRAILKILDLPVHLINLYTLISSLFTYYFYFITSSDAIATTFYIIAFYYTLQFLKTKLHWVKYLLLITMFLFIAGFMKYLFMPVIFTIPLFLILKGIIDKEKTIIKTGIFSSLLLSAALITLLLYQKNISGSPAYVSDAENGFFPTNLLSAYPILPSALIKPDTIALLLNKPGADSLVTNLFQWIYLFIIAAAVIYLGWRIMKYKDRKIKFLNNFILPAIGTCFATILLLAILSVRIAKAEDMPGNWWTFIQEPRYYGLPNILIHIGIFIFFDSYFNSKLRLHRYSCCIILLLLLPEMLRGVIFTAKRGINFNKEEYSWQSDLKFQQYADTIIKKERKDGEKAVVAGSVYYMNNRVSLYNNIPILNDVTTINNLTLLKSKKEILLLIILHTKNLEPYKSFLSEYDQQIKGSYKEYIFFTLHIAPG